MPRRLALSLLIAWLAWISPVSAQGPQPQGPPGPGYYGMAPGGPYTAGGEAGEYQLQPSFYEQLHPETRSAYDEYEPAINLGLSETFHRTWFRTDYLWMNYRPPGSRFIGAVPLTIPPATFDPRALFPAFDRVLGVRVGLEGRLVSLESSDYRDNHGLRMTMGVPTELFTWEASGFAMGEADSNLQFNNFLDVNSPFGETVIAAIPLTRNGLPAFRNYLLFDQGMNVNVRSNLQGVDTRFVFGAITPNVATEVAPLIGFNYLHYSNELSIRGDDSGTATSHRIDSRANNNIFGPEIGLRMETRSKWMTLGFEPKFTFGINRMSNHVATQQIFSPLEADREVKDALTRFSPVIELETYARFRLAENLMFSIGYQFMATTNVSMADQNIVWDSSSILIDPPRIGLVQNRDDFWMQGINVGLQWQF